MSGCRRWGGEIAAYLDGELPGEAAALFEAHLPDCSGCTAELAAWRGVDLRLAELPRLPLSAQFEARFWARLARSEEPAPRRSRWLRLPAFALAAAGVAGLLWLARPDDARLPEPGPDLEIVAEADFELLVADDAEILWELDDLEAWDGSEEI